MNRDSFTSFFPNFLSFFFFFFFCLIVLARTRSGKKRNPYLVPDLRGKHAVFNH